ncbi:hypothetical protein CRENBAI_012523 [Crenichthys baileyi]|uniref:Uncharacterized protein n=1 Tax=Crenichthys baileyi TaxID=28760 RepID=A0AAV9S845_9TELE
MRAPDAGDPHSVGGHYLGTTPETHLQLPQTASDYWDGNRATGVRGRELTAGHKPGNGPHRRERRCSGKRQI